MRQITAALLTAGLATSAVANTPITAFNSNTYSLVPMNKIVQLVKANVTTDNYRAIKTQVIHNKSHASSYVLIYLFSKQYHKVDVARLNINDQYQAIGKLQHNYQLSTQDFAQQPQPVKATCPDPTVQFIAFAPNQNQLELDITEGVAKFAEAAGLKTKRLYVKDATTENYINYLTCPKLEGNFYDGDANPQIITTNDGAVSHGIFETTLKNAFDQKVTNIWLACEAFNDPMKSAVIDSAQAQKYAAGINDLLIGPSDYAAACAMDAAITGDTIHHAMTRCIASLDKTQDNWGFGGKGSNKFTYDRGA